MRKIKILIRNFFKFFVRLTQPGSPLYIEQESTVSKRAALGTGVKFYRSSIDDYSYVSKGCFVESAKIGKFCSIAADCYIGGAAHPLDWVSTSPVFHSGGNVFKTHFSEHSFNPFLPTEIGNDVWIGYGSIIKSGITISDGAVIGSGSVVTKNVGPYEIWAGNPAKLIKKRFDDETINRLLDSKWWDYSKTQLSDAAKDFNNVETFTKEVK